MPNMRWLPRLLVVLWVVSRYRLVELLPASTNSFAIRLLRGLSYVTPRYPQCKDSSVDKRLRLALQQLGPIYVKFGQLLSTRRDMLPEAMADELALLQDQVEPFSHTEAISIIEAEFGRPIAQLFASFDDQPLASASVAQVHAATLSSGDDVVVKVIRPNLEPIIQADLHLMFRGAKFLEQRSTDARRLRLIEVVSDYEQVIFNELDLKQEAANGSQLQHNFTSDENAHLLQVPTVYWDYSTERVLVMQRMYGVPISDISTLKSNGTDLKLLAERGVEIFFTQVFEHNFFHADMHPGNIFVDCTNPNDPIYIALDCAIMGSLPESDRYYTARVLLAALDRDYRLVAKLHLDAGWIKPDTNIYAFESLIRSVCEPIISRPLSQLKFGTLLIYLFRAARRFGMEVQPSLILLQKTIVNVEGLGQQLYPDLDLWQTAQPFLARWVKDRMSPLRILGQSEERFPAILEAIPLLSERIISQLQQLGSTKESESVLHQRIQDLENRSQKINSINASLLVISVVCICIAAAQWL